MKDFQPFSMGQSSLFPSAPECDVLLHEGYKEWGRTREAVDNRVKIKHG